jgi:hypothetical protein
MTQDNGTIRQFETGATRDTAQDKFDFEGFLSPLVLERYAQYMHKHRKQSDGSLRDSDNWQKGIPKDVYMKSGYRHFFDWWKEHRGIASREGLEDALCAILFNVMGYLHEVLKGRAQGMTSEQVLASPLNYEIHIAKALPEGQGYNWYIRGYTVDRKGVIVMAQGNEPSSNLANQAAEFALSAIHATRG